MFPTSKLLKPNSNIREMDFHERVFSRGSRQNYCLLASLLANESVNVPSSKYALFLLLSIPVSLWSVSWK